MQHSCVPGLPIRRAVEALGGDIDVVLCPLQTEHLEAPVYFVLLAANHATEFRKWYTVERVATNLRSML